MSDVDKSFSSAVAAFYETYMVPMIFDGYAEDLAEKVAAAAPSAVLETAAGTGVVTRALAPRLKAGARYVVTDLNPPMLEEARRRQGDGDGIEWLPADALSLPFPMSAPAVITSDIRIRWSISRAPFSCRRCSTTTRSSNGRQRGALKSPNAP